VTAGLIIVLGDDGKPESLATLQARLERGASGLKQFCDGVVALPPPDEGRKGVIGRCGGATCRDRIV
jgi:hypothetical protein